MLKKPITYKNFDGVNVTEDFYFNLTKAELVELDLGEKDGLSKTLQAIIDSQDGAKIIGYFKRIILMAYGERSDDGRKFIKSDEIANSFSHTEAYSQLFMELATDANAASTFVNAIMPSDLVAEVAALSKTKPTDPKVDESQEVLLVPTAPSLDPIPASQETQKTIEEMTRDELAELLRSKESQ